MKKPFFILLIILLHSEIIISQIEISSGLVAHYSFDGHTLDSAANAFHGTGYNITFENGPIGQAAVFNGTNSRIYIPSHNTPPSDSISDLSIGSISLWFKFQNQGPDMLPLLYFGEKDTGTPHNSLIIEVGHAQDQNNRKLYFTIVNQSFCFDSNVNLSENTWYHFVCVVSDTGNTGFLNGIELTGRHYNLGSDYTYTDFFADVPVNEIFTIGYGRYGQQDPFYHFKGSIDDVRIYSRALNITEVWELYSQMYTNISDNNLTVSDVFFPNPCMDKVYFMKQYNLIEIFDLKGNLLLSFSNCATCDVTSLSEGMYIIKATTLMGVFYSKLLVNR